MYYIIDHHLLKNFSIDKCLLKISRGTTLDGFHFILFCFVVDYLT